MNDTFVLAPLSLATQVKTSTDGSSPPRTTPNSHVKANPSPTTSPPDYTDDGRYDRRSYSPRPRSYSRSRSRSYSRSPPPPSYYERSRHYRPHRPPRHHYMDTYYGRRYPSYPRRSRSPPPRRYRSRSPPVRTYRTDCRVYVGNLSYETRWTDLKDFMRKEAGPVVHADIMKSGSNRSLGCGTVEFEFPEDAQRAIRMLNDVEFMGRVIFLREDRTHDTRKDNYVAPDDCRLFVDNLPLTASWQDMKDLFRKAGRVLHTDVTSDPLTRRPNGTGLVIFDDHRDARNAIDMFNDYEWQGYRLRVMEERSAPIHLAPSTTSLPPPPPPPPLPPQSVTSAVGLPVSTGSSTSNNATPRPLTANPGPPPPPPLPSSSSSSSSSSHTPSQQPPANTPSMPGLIDSNSGNGRSMHDSTGGDGYTADHYNGGSTYYGEAYFDDRYDQPLGAIPHPPPPPPPPPPSIAAAAAAGLPLFPSLVSGPGANLPSHGVNQIFINKLPFATTSQDLIDLFRHVGPVVRSEILWYNGRPKGTGLVRFEDRLTCERAIAKFNGYLYGGRKLDIRMDKYSTST